MLSRIPQRKIETAPLGQGQAQSQPRTGSHCPASAIQATPVTGHGGTAARIGGTRRVLKAAETPGGRGSERAHMHIPAPLAYNANTKGKPWLVLSCTGECVQPDVGHYTFAE